MDKPKKVSRKIFFKEIDIPCRIGVCEHEKKQNYSNAPSGGPLVQHALLALMDLVNKKELSIEKMVEKTSHAVADCFNIEKIC